MSHASPGTQSQPPDPAALKTCIISYLGDSNDILTMANEAVALVQRLEVTLKRLNTAEGMPGWKHVKDNIGPVDHILGVIDPRAVPSRNAAGAERPGGTFPQRRMPS